MLLTGRIDNGGVVCDTAEEKIDEIWCIVRNLKNGLPLSNIPVYYVPQLSPSQDLYSEYVQRKNAGKWSHDMFRDWYTPKFLNEMQADISEKYLKLLKRRSQQKNVLILCYCPNKGLCHRSLVEEIVAGMPKQPEQEDPFYCLVAGSRGFDNFVYMKHKLDAILFFQDKVQIVSGGAKGADALAEQYAAYRGCELKVFPADWEKFGKTAGFKRNRQMHEYIADKKNRGVVCFWDGQSKGTADNFGLAKEFGSPLKICRYDQTEKTEEPPKEDTVNLDKLPCLLQDYKCNITIEDITYSNAEAAIQAQKCSSHTQKLGLSLLEAKEAKKIGDQIHLDEWEQMRPIARELILEEMLKQNKEIYDVLLATGNKKLTSEKDTELAEIYTRIRKSIQSNR